ncbi:hypothetical protein Csa_009957 [Cucumis sativus]|uniref:Uncharacterized protein n=1 Tax=Cucumis sativus TaxID=3659 RepID=A0A0A0L534_CUCSA|nr:hypothetical protein Csa_009957 [Cucumis sativus]
MMLLRLLVPFYSFNWSLNILKSPTEFLDITVWFKINFFTAPSYVQKLAPSCWDHEGGCDSIAVGFSILQLISFQEKGNTLMMERGTHRHDQHAFLFSFITQFLPSSINDNLFNKNMETTCRPESVDHFFFGKFHLLTKLIKFIP